MSQQLSYSKQYRAVWHDCAGRTQQRAFDTQRRLLTFVNRECKAFQNKVKLYRRVNGVWYRFVMFHRVPVFYEDAKHLLTQLLYH